MYILKQKHLGEDKLGIGKPAYQSTSKQELLTTANCP